MPTSQGKIYFGASLVAQPGEQWDYTRPYPPDTDASATWTIPGTLQATFTTSGTYTPAVGVSTVHVAVIGGGGNGGASAYASGSPPANYLTGGGGAGGNVSVYRNVPVSGPVAVTIGAAATASSFGALAAAAGGNGGQNLVGYNNMPNKCGMGGQIGNGTPTPGNAGALVNGTRYGGGGGPGNPSGNWGTIAGGAGGGGTGGGTTANGSAAVNALPGTAGTGGGGGGASTSNRSPGTGGSGRVVIWTEDI